MRPIQPTLHSIRGYSEMTSRLTLAGAVLLLGTGCARVLPTGDVVVSAPAAIDYCATARPVRVSKADTRKTKELADKEYRKYVAACGVPPA